MMEHVRAQTGTSSPKIKFQAQTRPPEESINARQDHLNTKKGQYQQGGTNHDRRSRDSDRDAKVDVSKVFWDLQGNICGTKGWPPRTPQRNYNTRHTTSTLNKPIDEGRQGSEAPTTKVPGNIGEVNYGSGVPDNANTPSNRRNTTPLFNGRHNVKGRAEARRWQLTQTTIALICLSTVALKIETCISTPTDKQGHNRTAVSYTHLTLPTKRIV